MVALRTRPSPARPALVPPRPGPSATPSAARRGAGVPAATSPATGTTSLLRPNERLAGPWSGARCRIRPLGRTVTSSAPCLRPRWRLEFEPVRPSLPDRLIGWCGGSDPRDPIVIDFPTREAALLWAARYGLEVDAEPLRRRTARPRPYAEQLRHP